MRPIRTILIATLLGGMACAQQSQFSIPGTAQAASKLTDANGFNALIAAGVASAANQVTITDSVAGASPTLSPSGSDTNIDLKLNGKGTGGIVFNNTSEIDGFGNMVIPGNFAVGPYSGAFALEVNRTAGDVDVNLQTSDVSASHVSVFRLTTDPGTGTTNQLAIEEINSQGGSLAKAAVIFQNVNGGGYSAFPVTIVSGSIGIGAPNGTFTATGQTFYANADGSIKLNGATFTVSTLGTCNSGTKGTIKQVTDAASPAWNATLTGGGSTYVLALCNGTNWTAH